MTKPELFPIDSFIDTRGSFTRTFDALITSGTKLSILQANISVNPAPFTLRGLHFQTSGPREDKYISVVSGSAFLVAVDLREDSQDFLEKYTFELSCPLRESIHIPSGFATGWISTSPNTIFQYLMSARFEECSYSGLRFDDPGLSIEWPRQPSVISERDLSWPTLREYLGG